MVASVKVSCPSCGRKQADLGKRTTCVECGLSPIPSYAYAKRCCFHPQWRPPKRRKPGPIALR
jgi:hypothetical protein